MADDGGEEGLEPERGETRDKAGGLRSVEPKYRTISDAELGRLIADHKKWVETGGKEGTCADLSSANLKDKPLQCVKLHLFPFPKPPPTAPPDDADSEPESHIAA